MPHAYTEDQQAPRTLTLPLPRGEEADEQSANTAGLFVTLGWQTRLLYRGCA